MFTVAHLLGWLFVVQACVMLIPMMIAFAFKETLAIQAFLAVALGNAFVGGGLILALEERRSAIRRKESFFIVCVIWIVMPLTAALPFFLAGYPDTPVKAIFEAVSALTTTGASVLDDLSEVPRSLLFFRSLLQWLGGLMTLLILALILGPMTGPRSLDRKLQQINKSTLGTKRQLFEVMRTLIPLYSALTVLCFCLLVVARIPAFDALCLAFSTLSTGGFMPRAGTVALYGSPMAELVLAVFMFLGAVSIFWIRGLMQVRRQSLGGTGEPIWIGLIILVFGCIVAVPLLINSPEQGFRSVYHSLTLGIATAASIVSTTGFMISEQTQGVIPYVVFFMFCLVGGGAFSTAGGLKVFRFMLMLQFAAQDLRQLVFPHGVQSEPREGNTTETTVYSLLSANFAVIIIAVGGLALVLSVADLPLPGAFMAAVAAISNIGPAYGMIDLPELSNAPSYSEFTPFAQAALSVGMILGRVEVLALLSLLNIAYWRS